MSDLIEQDGQYMKFTSKPWVILSPIEQSIKEKLEKYGTPLKDWDIEINYGIKTGCNEAFIINEAKRAELIKKDPKSAEIIRPILRGKDIKRYGYDFKGLYLIATHNGYKDVPRVNIDDYPAIKEWLDNGGIAYNGKEYKGYEIIAKRADQGDTPYNLRSCAYMDDFSKPKIVYQELTQGSRFAIDKAGEYFVSNTAYLLTGDKLQYLLKVLNSKIIEFAFKTYYSTSMGNTGIRWLNQYIMNLPIVVPLYDTEQAITNSTGIEIEQHLGDLYHLSDLEMQFISASVKQ